MTGPNTQDLGPDSLGREAALWVARIQDCEAAESDFTDWQEWLAQDPRHAEAYEAAEEIWALAGQVKPVPWPTGEELQAETCLGPESTLRNKGRATEKGAKPPDTRRTVIGGLKQATSRRTFALAAALIVCLAVTVWVVLARGPRVLETTTAEQRSVRLPDGSRVTLAAETRLIEQFGGGRRNLDLEHGEAYFEVAHDAAHPFTVRVGNHEAVAVGTAFDIDANDDQMTVTVTEGIVKLRSVPHEPVQAGPSSSTPAATAALELTVGERAQADSSGARRLAAIITPERAVAWRDGRLEYLHESLRVVIHDVNRYTDRKIELADESLGDLHYTGTVFLDQLDAWLSGLPGTFPVEVLNRGSHRILRHVGERPVEARAPDQEPVPR